MPHCRRVEFLRRRYAAAILRDDAATAARLRADLDAVMNGAAPASRRAPASWEPAREPVAAAPGPQLRLVMPVTGLLEWSAPRPAAAAPRNPA